MSDSHLAIDNSGNNLCVHQDNQVEEVVSTEKQRQELQELQEQHNQAVQKAQSAIATFESISRLFSELVTLKRRLEQEKDDLGIKAQEIRDRLKVLKRETCKVEAQLQQVCSKYEVAKENKVVAETHLAKVTDRLKVLAAASESQKPYSNFEVNSMSASDSRGTLSQKEKSGLFNPWRSGSFYLFTVVVILLILAVINMYMSWYTLIPLLIACLLITIVIGALQLRNDKNLSEANFVRLIVESLKRLPLLRIDSLQEKKLKN